MKAFSVAVLVSALIASPALAQPGPQMMKKFGDWSLYSYKSGGGSKCYVLSTPEQALPANVTHGDNFFLVAPDPSGGGYYPQVIMGYDLKGGSQITVTIGDNAYPFAPKGNSGWTQQQGADASVVAAMKSGDHMEVSAVSQRGTQTRYTYSLTGVSAALAQAGKCR